MACYVDELRTYNGLTGEVGRWGKRWCHLFADTEEELHAAAEKIGMKRRWYQPGRQKGGYDWYHSHYDLVPSRRAAAIRVAGALEVSGRDMAERWLREKRLIPEPGPPAPVSQSPLF
jgi:hypothetical protein